MRTRDGGHGERPNPDFIHKRGASSSLSTRPFKIGEESDPGSLPRRYERRATADVPKVREESQLLRSLQARPWLGSIFVVRVLHQLQLSSLVTYEANRPSVRPRATQQ